MSQWHREHPELAGTEADVWMRRTAHAAAAREVTAMRCPRSMETVLELEAGGDGCPCGSPSFSHHPEAPGGS